MVIAKAVVAILLADTNITALVGTRITPKLSPEGSPFPNIVYDCGTAQIDRSMNGPGSLTQQSFEVSALATSYGGAEQLGAFIRKSLDGKGNSSTAYGGIVLADVSYDDEEEGLEQIGDAGQESNVHTRTVKFNCWFYMPA
jgi:hypothetical protein